MSIGNGVNMVPRDNWAQYPADPDKMTESDGNYRFITLHHTGSEDTPESVESLQRDKLGPVESFARRVGQSLGLAQTYPGQGDISYNFLIDKDGLIYQGRSLDYVGAHVGGNNRGNIGIAFLGDYSDKPLSDAQVHSSIQLIDRLNAHYGYFSQGSTYGPMPIVTHGFLDVKKHDELGAALSQIQAIRNSVQQSWEKR